MLSKKLTTLPSVRSGRPRLLKSGFQPCRQRVEIVCQYKWQCSISFIKKGTSTQETRVHLLKAYQKFVLSESVRRLRDLGFNASRLTTDDAKILQHSALYFCNSVSDCMLAPPFLQGTACNVADVSQFLVTRKTFS